MPTIFTVGHSTREWSPFCDLLVANGITILADIRSFPGSRRYPQFNKEAMRQALPAIGIAYHHLPALGGRRRGQPDSLNTTWRNPSFRAYADYMETTEFLHGVNELEALTRLGTVAYMCSEAVWWRCHRSMLSDYLLSLGWEVWHIMENGRKPHTYTSPARLCAGHLTYHAA